MSGRDNVRECMQVYGSDNRLLGTVERVSSDRIHVGLDIPRSAIGRVAEDRVFVQEPTGATLGGQESRQGDASTAQRSTLAAQQSAMTGQRGGLAAQQEAGEVRIPVAEERLHVETREAELGQVQVHKSVVEEPVEVPVELRREEVHVERRDVGDRPATDAGLFQEGTIRVPVRGEEAVVQKEAVVTGEVVIGKERVRERQEITDTVRRERVEVDENYNQYRSGFQQHFNQRQASLQGQQGYTARTFEQAEPNYQYGYAAARGAQYQGRDFDAVEPDLRRDYESRFGSTQTGGGGDAWQHLREEIREGWDRARSR